MSDAQDHPATARLLERLDGPTATVHTLPDGSIDTYCRVEVGGGTPVSSRAAFGEHVAGASKSVHFVTESREVGGQAVNMASGAHALGDAVTCYGHLDDPLFAALPFETVSMGSPATVFVCSFPDDDEDLIVASSFEDVNRWDIDALRAVADLDRALAADALCVGNWISSPRMSDALRAMAPDLACRTLVIDPGDVAGTDPGPIRDLAAALRAVATETEVVLSINERELRAFAHALDGAADHRSRLARVREATGVAAVTCHDRPEATAATPEGHLAVPVVTVESRYKTGAGDRFSAGIAHARAVGWDWDVALALGGACASHYVRTGESATRADVRALLSTDTDLPGDRGGRA